MKRLKKISLVTFFCVQTLSLAALAETAYLGGGCFWGVQDLLRKQPGVTATEVGYMGGEETKATYELVKTGKTGYAETVKIDFDPKKTSYEKLLLYFFKIHDPTTMNQQGNDIGNQYRSAIFYHDEKQKKIATDFKAKVDLSKAWKKPVVTEITSAKKFWPAEEYHQKYLIKNPNGYDNHYMRNISFDAPAMKKP